MQLWLLTARRIAAQSANVLKTTLALIWVPLVFAASAPSIASTMAADYSSSVEADVNSTNEEAFTRTDNPANAQQLFNQANELLTQHRYSEALSIYGKITEGGHSSGPLFLNMAIAANNLDSLGLASLYFRKAQRYAETDAAASEGLAFVQGELARRGARLPELGWLQFTSTIYFEVNYRFWLITGIALLNLGAVLFILFWLRQRYLKSGRGVGLVVMSVGIMLIVASLVLSSIAGNFERAVQTAREAQIHEQPDPNAEIIQTGFEGFLYIVNRKESLPESGWLRVRLTNGSQGWVQSDAVKRF
jgi:tetratricopeptide (TPR) repeat protein